MMLMWMALGSYLAGLLGSLTGLGGGVVIVPMLTVLFGVDMHYAAGASLVSVMATSSGAAAAYVREGYTNLRIGIFLEVATTLGAMVGAHLATQVSTSTLSVTLGCVLMVSAVLSGRRHETDTTVVAHDVVAERLRLEGSYPVGAESVAYRARRVPLGFGLMTLAGGLSGLLGIGSGALKVVAMDLAMALPFKVSTTTSNFMIGVTAAASAGVYLRHGYIQPMLLAPVMLGVLAGSFTGSRLLGKAPTATLRRIFTVVVVILAIEMMLRR